MDAFIAVKECRCRKEVFASKDKILRNDITNDFFGDPVVSSLHVHLCCCVGAWHGSAAPMVFVLHHQRMCSKRPEGLNWREGLQQRD